MFALGITVSVLASLVLGPERPLTPPGERPAAGAQSEPELATSGSEILVTWLDVTPGRSGLYVAAVTEEGLRIAGTQRRLSEDVSLRPPRIVWTGSAYLILWTSADSEIKVMTIDRDRRVVTPENTIMRSAVATSNVVRLGNRCAVLAARDLLVLDLSGTVVHKGPDLNPGAPVLGGHLATDGESLFAFWNAWDDSNVGKIYVRRFTKNGEARDAAPVAVTPDLRAIREDWEVAFGDGAFAIVAAEHRGDGDDDGRTLRPFLVNASTLATTTLPSLVLGLASGTDVEWAGDRFVALWFQVDEANVARMRTMEISPAGALGTPVVQCAAHGFPSSELWTGGRLVTAFTVLEPRSFDTDVYAAAPEPAGATPCSAVAFSPLWQSSPAVATSGTHSLMVWTEGTNEGVVRVSAVRTTMGVPDRAAIVLTENGEPAAPAVVYTGSVYVVAWLEFDDFGPLPIVQMQRITADGVLLDPEPIALDYGVSVSIAVNTNGALIAWCSGLGVRAARLTRGGALLENEALAINPDGLRVVAASNGSDFLVVWEEGSDAGPDRVDLRGRRIDNSGALMGASISIATGSMDQRGAAVASDGRDYLVAYLEDDRLVSRKVLREGILSGSTAVDPGTVIEAGVRSSVSMSYLTDGYAVVCEADDPDGFEVRFAALDREGRVSQGPATLARSPIGGTGPTLATSAGRGDLVYSLFTGDELLGGSMRLFTRRIGPDTNRVRAVRH